MDITNKTTRLDFSKINKRKHKTMSSTDALKGVVPIKWSDDALSGKKMVKITKA